MNGPLVSIGVPVFNEASHLAAALDSLVSQTYTNLEIIVCDNASTDATTAICAAFSDKDPRIKVHRQLRNQGSTHNFQNAFDLSSGGYFMWAAGHDLWSPNYVADCVSALERDPGAVLAYGQTQWVDASGAPLAKRSGSYDTRGLDPVARYVTVLHGNMHPIMGVIRRSVLAEVLPLPNCAGSDLVVLCALALHGDFACASTATWYRRQVRDREGYGARMARYRSGNYGLVTGWFNRIAPIHRLPLELMHSVLRAPLGSWDKALILCQLCVTMPIRYLSARYYDKGNRSER